MQTKSFSCVRVMLLCVLAATLGAGCVTKDDPVAQAEKKDVAKGVPAPSIAETKAIAEEGLHLRAAARDELCGDERFQHQSRFRPIQRTVQRAGQRGARLHVQGHGRRHAQQRHALFFRVARSARGAVCDLGSRRSDKARYYSVQLCDGNTFNYGYIGSRGRPVTEAGDYLVVGSRLERRSAARHQEGIHVVDAILHRDLPHPTVQSSGHAERGQGPGRLQSAAAFGVSQTAGTHRLRRRSTFPKIDKELAKTNFFDYLDFALQFAPPWARGKGDSREARDASASVPARPSISRIFLLEHKAAVLLAMKEGDAKVDDAVDESRHEDQRLERKLRSRVVVPSTTATGCCAPPRQRPASTATIRWKPPIP